MITIDYLKTCVVLIYSGNKDYKIRLGTGFFVLPEGYILTCYHVFSNNKVDINTTSIFIEWDNNHLIKCEYISEY